MLSEVGPRQSLAKARPIMEGAYGLREDVLLRLLAQCASVKTVRLYLTIMVVVTTPEDERDFGVEGVG